MKKFLFIFLLATCTNSFAKTEYCPDSFVCDKKGCNFSDDWDLDLSITGFKPDKATYTFMSATVFYNDTYLTTGEAICMYKPKNSFGLPVTIRSYMLLTPDMRAPGNNWVFHANFRASCSGDAQRCPLDSYF